jgi:hypothetical protein
MSGRNVLAHSARKSERIMKQTSHRRDTEVLRTQTKRPFLCASMSLWLMQSIFSQLRTPVPQRAGCPRYSKCTGCRRCEKTQQPHGKSDFRTPTESIGLQKSELLRRECPPWRASPQSVRYPATVIRRYHREETLRRNYGKSSRHFWGSSHT